MSLLIAMLTVPGLLGTQEAIRQAQSKDKREEHRSRRCNFVAHCIKSSIRSREINDRPLVLRDGRIFIDTGTQDYDVDFSLCMACGYYLPYPDSTHEGLVTKISMHEPIMNWMFIDRETHQLRYGVRKDADGNITGPFDCTTHKRRVTLFKWEGWCAVEEEPDVWAVYFDVHDNGLRGKVSPDARILEIELERREARYRRVEYGVIPRPAAQTSESDPDVESNDTEQDHDTESDDAKKDQDAEKAPNSDPGSHSEPINVMTTTCATPMLQGVEMAHPVEVFSDLEIYSDTDTPIKTEQTLEGTPTSPGPISSRTMGIFYEEDLPSPMRAPTDEEAGYFPKRKEEAAHLLTHEGEQPNTSTPEANDSVECFEIYEPGSHTNNPPALAVSSQHTSSTESFILPQSTYSDPARASKAPRLKLFPSQVPARKTPIPLPRANTELHLLPKPSSDPSKPQDSVRSTSRPASGRSALTFSNDSPKPSRLLIGPRPLPPLPCPPTKRPPGPRKVIRGSRSIELILLHNKTFRPGYTPSTSLRNEAFPSRSLTSTKPISPDISPKSKSHKPLPPQPPSPTKSVLASRRTTTKYRSDTKAAESKRSPSPGPTPSPRRFQSLDLPRRSLPQPPRRSTDSNSVSSPGRAPSPLKQVAATSNVSGSKPKSALKTASSKHSSVSLTNSVQQQVRFPFMEFSEVDDAVKPRFRSLEIPREEGEAEQEVEVQPAAAAVARIPGESTAKRALQRVTRAGTGFFGAGRGGKGSVRKKVFGREKDAGSS